MFNTHGFNFVPFNQILEVPGPSGWAIGSPNDLTLIYETDVIPVTYIGEQHSFANSPWTPHDVLNPYQWILSRDLRLFFASADGRVYEYGVGNTDNGFKINDYYETKYIDIGAPDRVKRLRWIDIDAESEPGTMLRVLYKIDHDTEWRQFCELEQGNYKYVFAKIDAPLFRRIKLRFESGYTGCKYVVNSFSLDLVIHGQQKEMVK